jgi:hypothetical protein
VTEESSCYLKLSRPVIYCNAAVLYIMSLSCADVSVLWTLDRWAQWSVGACCESKRKWLESAQVTTKSAGNGLVCLHIYKKKKIGGNLLCFQGQENKDTEEWIVAAWAHAMYHKF